MRRRGEKQTLDRREGMALALTLVVLLVAGAMVGTSMYFVENMMSTTKMKTDDELRMNAAIAGIEVGKQWIIQRVDDHDTPERKDEDGDSLLTSADIAAAPSTPPFAYLLAYDGDDNPGSFSFTHEGAQVQVHVYDLAYEPGSGIAYEAGMPPRMRYIWTSSALEGSSIVQTQSYASSNRGGAAGGAGTAQGEFGSFLIRSTATMNGIEKTVEQSVIIRD